MAIITIDPPPSSFCLSHVPHAAEPTADLAAFGAGANPPLSGEQAGHRHRLKCAVPLRESLVPPRRVAMGR
jgi:hypothetical protein